jgi:hypothetical protein
MHMKRPRFTVKSMMIAVLAVAAPLGWFTERHRRFSSLAAYHSEQSGILGIDFSGNRQVLYITGPDGKPLSKERHEWHSELSGKYRRASLRPWLPVSADPPMP